MRKIKLNHKIFISVIILATLFLSYVGFTSVSAKPTLEDMIGSRIYGTYVPNFFYDDGNTTTDDWSVVGIIKNTNITVDYSLWHDYNSDNLVNLEDVYQQEGYQFKFLINETEYPILKTSPYAEYYMVQLREINQIDEVIASVEVACNNDNAEMKSQKDYYFDSDTNILYLGPALVKNLNSGIDLRIQTVGIVHNIDTFTKEFAVAVEVAGGINETPLFNRVPNGIFKRSVKNWLISGMDINLIQPEHLSYVSKENLTVYVNEQEFNDFNYDPTNGILSFPNSKPYDIDNVAVFIEKLNNVTSYQTSMQKAQYDNGNETAQAITWADVPVNNMCQHLNFVREPVVGNVEPLDFYAFMQKEVDLASGNTTTVDFDNMSVSSLTIFPEAVGSVSDIDLKNAVAYAYDSKTITIDTNRKVTSEANDVLGFWRPIQASEKPDVQKLFNELQNMYSYYNTYKSTAPTAYIDAVTASLQNITKDNGSNNGMLLNYWQYWDHSTNSQKQSVGLYIVGKTNGATNILDGTVTRGYPYFTVSCAQMNLANELPSYTPIDGIDKSDIHKTVISIVGKDDKYLYLCISPASFYNGSVAYQRLCGFTKVEYTYTGKGSITFTKIDEQGYKLAGADYQVYRINADGTRDTSFATRHITSSDEHAIVITDLDYNKNGTKYVLEEETPPSGFLRDPVQHKYIINDMNVNQTVVVSDARQYVNVTLTCIDATTFGFPNEHPVSDLKFTLYDSSGRVAMEYKSDGTIVKTWENMVTNANGEIKMRVYPGFYYLRQIDTAENYYLDYHAESKPGDMYDCNYIEVNVPATREGTHINKYIRHYEKRQTVSILTQVQDSVLGNKTPANLGGTDAGRVTTLNAEYELYVKNGLILTVGYRKDGTPVKISNATGPLNIQKHDGQAAGYSYEVNGMSYISAAFVTVDGVQYPLPNGEYYWKLRQAPTGYVTSADRTTNLDGKWLRTNNQLHNRAINDDVVTIDRQTISINVFSKPYTKEDSLSNYAYEIATQIPVYRYNKETKSFDSITNSRIDIASTKKNISENSKESVIAITNSTRTVYVDGCVPNTIYQLQNICDVVAKGGGVIKANTILGRYISDSKGKIYIDSFGSNSFDNPNVTSNDYTISIPAISVIDNKGQGVNNTELPNGTYILSVVLPADDYEIENEFENMFFTAPWSRTDSKKDNLDLTVLTPLYNAFGISGTKEHPNTYAVMAPSPIDTTPEDPYDPLHPSNGSDDSDDIPIPENTDWIIDHKNDRTYRIFDDTNMVTDGIVSKYDVEDTIPTTFAATYIDSTEADSWETTYELYVYYEITENEWKKEGLSAIQLDRNWNYRIREEGGIQKYYKRLMLPSSSSDNRKLAETIVFNKTSPAYDGLGNIKRNEILVGAIYDTKWLNNRMALTNSKSVAGTADSSGYKFDDGTYHIAIGVLAIKEKDVNLSGIHVRKEEFVKDLAIIEIRNRQMFTLD